LARPQEDLVRGAFLHEPARVEDADALAHLRDDGQVVADEEDARSELLAQGGDEVEHLSLDGGVEARRRLVEDEKRRVLRQGHRDDDALLHPSRELVGIAAHDALGIGDLHLVQHRLAPA
jgi:hypothetical protein